MLFQVLDAKKDCVGYYANKKLHSVASIPYDGTTWEYSGHLPGSHYELGRLYSNGASLTEVCPPHLKNDWEKIKSTFKSCLKAFQSARLSLDDNCLYDVVPEYFLFQFLELKNKITEHVLSTSPRPKNYDSMYNLLELLQSIRGRPLNIDTARIAHLFNSVRGKNFQRTLQTAKHICDYNPWGTVTGRLATMPRGFPILTMNKEFRACVKPHNDWLLELDFNAAELRVLLALSGAPQPPKDIHDWNVKNVFGGELTREEAKVKTFAWLYSQRSNQQLEGLYNKGLVKKKYWDGFRIETDYGRIIEEVDEHHALNYIVQSTTIDMVHEQAHKVHELLKGRKSYISFLIHDAVYIDLADDDRYEILNLLDTFRKTRYDMFKVNVSAGRNLGDMKELRL
jgi:hypothetical protein